MSLKNKIAIGAIVKDEIDYIIEWIAYHKVAGFNSFYIVDNNSKDGTREILEILEDKGLVNLFYQPDELRAQIIAYNKILERAIKKEDYILFIDIDEFLAHKDNHIKNIEYNYLNNLINKNENIGMIAINWRVFGSSGHKKKENGLVIERFKYFAKDRPFSKNSLIKSVSKINVISHIGPHSSELIDESYVKVDANGNKIEQFLKGLKKPYEYDKKNGNALKKPVNSPIRINHYVIKSWEEFKIKQNKGCGMRGASFKKPDDYFFSHDLNEKYFEFSSERLKDVKKEMDNLKSLIDDSIYVKKLNGRLLMRNNRRVEGFICEADNIRVNVFVNEKLDGYTYTCFLRPKLKDKKECNNGFCGFRYYFKKPLKKGDVVEIKVYGNKLKFSFTVN